MGMHTRNQVMLALVKEQVSIAEAEKAEARGLDSSKQREMAKAYKQYAKARCELFPEIVHTLPAPVKR